MVPQSKLPIHEIISRYPQKTTKMFPFNTAMAMEDLQRYTILFLAWLVPAIVVVRALIGKTRANRRLPPSPWALPIIGHLHHLSQLPHQSFHNLSSRFGPLIHLYVGSVLVVVASSPEMAKEILKTQETSFLNRPHLSAIDQITYPSGNFVFAKFGPYWKFMRKLCMAQLLGGKTLNQLAPIRREELKRFLNSVLRKAEAKEGFDVGVEVGKFMNSVVSRMAFGRRCSEVDDETEEIRLLLKESSNIVGRFNLSDSFWFLRNLDLQGFTKTCEGIHDKFDALLDKIVSDHEEVRKMGNGKSELMVKDLLHILLDIAEDVNSEIRLNKVHIKAFILDMLAAGTDTSSVAIMWVLAELINHPNIMNKARQEIEAVVGKTRLVEESDIPKLPYIQAIVKETLRLHPASPLIVRASLESCNIKGYHIPEKARVLTNVWSIGRDSKYWEDPLEFKPERFLVEQGGEESQVDVRGQNFHLLPFGSGRRSCPGTTLALQVLPTSIAAMIQCFDWKVDSGDGIVDMEEAPGITLQRATPLVCVAIPRLSALPL